MNKCIVLGVVFLFVLMSLTSISGNQINNQIINSFDKGNILYVGGSGPGNYTTIQSAINDASDGDTVFVFNDSSPYYENIVIDKTLDFIGENKETTIIDGCDNDIVVKITYRNVILSGFSIYNGSNWDGINIRSDNNIIQNNIIKSNYNGIYIGYFDRGFYYTFDNNSIMDNQIINNNMDGIQTGGLNNDIISNDISQNKYYGIEKWGSFSNVSYNIICNNGNGLVLCFPGKNNLIHNNIFSNCFAGIQLGGWSQFNYIISNQFIENEFGIRSTPANNNNYTIKENYFENNTYGISLGYCWNSKIYHNNFIDNTKNAYDECNNTWDNGYPSGGNFWDDYNGIDEDGDGIGDTPYLLPGDDNVDRYPLGNFRPDTPIINGPTNGKPGVDYDYTFVTTDPEGDDVWYHISWDDYLVFNYGPYPSGEEITLSHNWSEKGTYIIMCGAIDIYDAESNITTYEVTIPRNKEVTSNMLLLRIFERFPLLQKLIQQLSFGL